MDAKEFVEWDARYSIGIPLIDDQHKQLILMTNELYKACRYGGLEAKEQFKATVHKAVRYVKYHFSTEEQIMAKINYPIMDPHKKGHKDFVQELLCQVRDFEEGKRFVPYLFVRYLRDWVLSHIALTDSHIGEYLFQFQKTRERQLAQNAAERELA